MNWNCGEYKLTKNLYLLFPYISHPKSIETIDGKCKEISFSCKCRLGTYVKIINEASCFGITFRLLGFGLLYLENN